MFFIRAAMCVVLCPGEAHISKTISFGQGFNVLTQITDGKFCKRAEPSGKKSLLKTGQPERFSSTSTATPLKAIFETLM